MSIGLLNLGGIAYELRAIVGNVMSIVLTKWTSNHLSCQDLTLRWTLAILFYTVSINDFSVFAASFNFASAAASDIAAFADSAAVATATFAAGFVVSAAAAIAIFSAMLPMIYTLKQSKGWCEAYAMQIVSNV